MEVADAGDSCACTGCCTRGSDGSDVTRADAGDWLHDWCRVDGTEDTLEGDTAAGLGDTTEAERAKDGAALGAEAAGLIDGDSEGARGRACRTGGDRGRASGGG